MTDGIRINYGETLGKASIFAKNHDHTENILEIFGKEYRNLPGYAKVIDHYMTDVQIAIDEFSESNKLPQIAISVGMLDTGIDVPEVLNLVFFKKVMSKAKFWQMIGRGTHSVSYTHLDVYKRQLHACSAPPMAAEKYTIEILLTLAAMPPLDRISSTRK